MNIRVRGFGALAAVAVLLTGVTSANVTAAPSDSTCPGLVTFSDIMVPSCGVLWGATGGAFEPAPAPQRHRELERLSGRTLGIYHAYYHGDQLFPFPDDIALLHEPGNPRVLLANWKVAEGMTWADVARGGADARIDAWSQHIKDTFPDRFFLAIHHEPENDVDLSPGSGMTPIDYRNMFRHTVQRLRADGVDNAIIVWNVMGYSGWIEKPWFETLYPGDDVVDWVAWDPYVRSEAGASQGGMHTLLNGVPERTTLPDGSPFRGTYDYMLARHGEKPFMLAEFGFQRTSVPADVADGPGSRAHFYERIGAALHEYPHLRALVYFDTAGNPLNPVKDPPTNVDESPESLAAWRALNRDPRLLNPAADAGASSGGTGIGACAGATPW